MRQGRRHTDTADCPIPVALNLAIAANAVAAKHMRFAIPAGELSSSFFDHRLDGSQVPGVCDRIDH